MLTVFGSLNVDVCVRTDRMPRPGETLLGANALVSPGGKGANQAHAAALFGAFTHMHGAVGDDRFAETALSMLRADGVNVSGVEVVHGESTGLAVITVDATGENAIVVAAGANACACAACVPDAVLAASRVLLLQLEVSWVESLALALRTRQLDCKVILNASPMPPAWDIAAGIIDTLILNQIELEQLCARLSVVGTDPMQQAVLVAKTLDASVLVTLGAEGSLLARANGVTHSTRATRLPQVVDSTGAGDTYAGVFAAALTMGHSAEEAMEAASSAAGLACQQAGAQAAQPDRETIHLELARRKEAQ